MSRRKAAWFVTSVCGVIGVFCALSMGVGKEYTLFGMNLFDIFDFLTAKLMLPIGGFFISIFTGWYLDKRILRAELNSGGGLHPFVYKAIVIILLVVIGSPVVKRWFTKVMANIRGASIRRLGVKEGN